MKNVGRRNRELPALVSVDERQIGEGAAIDSFLLRGYAIDESKLPGDLIARVTEQRKSESVLVRHEERLFHGLGRDRHQRGSRLRYLGKNAIHGFQLPAAERVPTTTKEAHNQSTTLQEVRRG